MTATPRPDSIPGIDVLSHDVWAQGIPHGAFDRLRNEAPVAWMNETSSNGLHGGGLWTLTRWEDIVAVQRDWRTFSSEIGGTEIEEMEPDARDARRTMLETDPPRHTALRRLINAPFTRRAMMDYTDEGRRMVTKVIDEVIDADSFDGVYALARELPIRLLLKLLGVPDSDSNQLFRWADEIIYNADPDYSAAVIDVADTDPYRLLPFRSPVALEVFNYLEPLLASRRADPMGDVMSIIADAEVDGVALTERQKHTWFLLLLIAGNETTRHALVHTLLAFARFPDQYQRLRDDPSIMETAIDECLRWATPQLHFRRTATMDTEIAGVPIAAGDKLVTWYIAGNYDPAQFPDPHRFDLTRTPNQHITFGYGVHLCIGQWLARLEVRVLLETLIERVQRIELCGDPVRVRSNFINGHKALPLRFVKA
jgi:cytochrome P450